MKRILRDMLSGNECPRKMQKKKHNEYLTVSENIDKIFMDLSDSLQDDEKIFEDLMRYERMHIKSERLLKEEYFIKGFLLATKIIRKL